MKRLFSLMTVLLLALLWGGSSLKAEDVLTENNFTAADIAAMTSSQKIAIRAVQNSAYTTYLTGSNSRSAFNASTCVFIIEPISGGDFYLKLANPTAAQGEGYLQSNTTLTYGAQATAQVLHAVLPSDTGSGETACSYANIWSGADKSKLVRFVQGSTGGGTKFFNVTYYNFGTGNGIWSYFLVHEVKEVTFVDVTMNYYNEDGTVLLGSATEQCIEGETPTAAIPSYVEITNNPFEGRVVSAGDSYDVYTRIKSDAPFQVSASTDDATANWFGMKIRSTLWVFEGGDELVRTQAVDYSLPTFKNYQWCLTGDWFNGFTITNRGNGKHMADLGNLNPNNSNHAAINTTDDAGLTGTHVFKLVTPSAGRYCFLYKGETNAYLSNKGGSGNQYLSKYSLDGGADITFMPLSESDAVAAYKNSISSTQGFVGGYSAADLAGLNALSTTEECAAFDAALATKSVIVFDDAKYYRVKNYARNLSIDNGVHIGQGGYMGIYHANNEAPISCHNELLSEPASVWKFEKDAESENYRIYNLNAKAYIGKSHANGSQYFTLVTASDDAGLFSLTEQASATAQHVIACTNGAGTHTQLHVSGSGVMNYNAHENSASAWYLAPADELEVNLNANGTDYWASLYLPFDVTLPAEVEAYAAKGHGSDYVSLTAVSGTLAAEDGVILKTSAATVSLPILTTSAAKTAGNLFEGVLEKTDITDNQSSFYTLGASGDVVGLYHPAATYLKANRAYLPATALTLASGLRFVFDDELTGVSEVNAAENETKACYDLTGRRVYAPKHGIYVIGNKKVLIP